MIFIGELWIQNEQEVHLARQWTQKLARMVKLGIGNHARLTTAVSQIAQSLFYYSKCVHIIFDVYEDEEKQWLRITIQESKNFIPSTEQHKQPTLSKPDLLKWLGFAKIIVSRFSIRAEEGTPIEVVLEKPIPPWTSYVTEEEVKAWQLSLQGEAPLTLLEEILQQNQELVQVLDALREKDKMLEQKIAEIQKLEALRDELVHTLVHDLRNPLATIRSSLSGLLYNDWKNLSPYQSAMVETSYLGAKNMTELVDNILAMHKLEREDVPLVIKFFSIRKLVQEVMEIQKPIAKEKNIRLSRHISRNIPPIEGDIHLIKRVLQNLMDNALKFTPEGGQVLITGKCLDPQANNGQSTPSPSPDQYISISVKDTGPGVPPEIESKLFEKFTTGLHEESGSGLGLAFCRMAIQAHGGEIWVKNNGREGATFTFILPLTLLPKDRHDD